MRTLLPLLALILTGCDAALDSPRSTTTPQQTLPAARQEFVTQIVKAGESFGPAETPVGGEFELIGYQSPVGPLAAYVTVDPGDGRQHPAIEAAGCQCFEDSLLHRYTRIGGSAQPEMPLQTRARRNRSTAGRRDPPQTRQDLV